MMLMRLYGVANSCVKAVTPVQTPEFFRPRDTMAAAAHGRSYSLRWKWLSLRPPAMMAPEAGRSIIPHSYWPRLPLTADLSLEEDRDYRPRWYNGHPLANTERVAAAGATGSAILPYLLQRTPKWRNGRRAGLKNRWGQPHVGSTPTFGTSISATKTG